ncbi:hypothetical protein JX266_006476 [Neoarthrinium moseri]|nr:hypothetical protein JX266_006476 [Neoarthrinium moseri]
MSKKKSVLKTQARRFGVDYEPDEDVADLLMPLSRAVLGYHGDHTDAEGQGLGDVVFAVSSLSGKELKGLYPQYGLGHFKDSQRVEMIQVVLKAFFGAIARQAVTGSTAASQRSTGAEAGSRRDRPMVNGIRDELDEGSAHRTGGDPDFLDEDTSRLAKLWPGNLSFSILWRSIIGDCATVAADEYNSCDDQRQEVVDKLLEQNKKWVQQHSPALAAADHIGYLRRSVFIAVKEVKSALDRKEHEAQMGMEDSILGGGSATSQGEPSSQDSPAKKKSPGEIGDSQMEDADSPDDDSDDLYQGNN